VSPKTIPTVSTSKENDIRGGSKEKTFSELLERYKTSTGKRVRTDNTQF
jgi:hypothetical protein